MWKIPFKFWRKMHMHTISCEYMIWVREKHWVCSLKTLWLCKSPGPSLPPLWSPEARIYPLKVTVIRVGSWMQTALWFSDVLPSATVGHVVDLAGFDHEWPVGSRGEPRPRSWCRILTSSLRVSVSFSLAFILYSTQISLCPPGFALAQRKTLSVNPLPSHCHLEVSPTVKGPTSIW